MRDVPDYKTCLHPFTLAVLACCGGDPVTPLSPPPGPDFRKPLFWEIHPSHQVLEAQVRTEIVKTGINFQQHHPVRAFPVCGFQPLECLVWITKRCVDPGPAVWRYVTFL